jgi:signal peptidase I
VLCPEPNAQGRAVVGRLVGDPGDTVVVKGSEVSVNDHKAYTERACLASEFLVRDPNVGANVKQSCQVEVLNGHVHMRGSVGGYKMVPPDAKKEVEDGRAFLLSDNRLFPYDSRDYGTVERGSCAEAVVFRLSGGKGFFDQSSRFTFIQ